MSEESTPSKNSMTRVDQQTNQLGEFELGFSTSINPVLMKCIRSRLRPGKAISWGFIGVALAIFAYVMVLTIQVKQIDVALTEAAQRATLWVFAIQAFVMMFMGTGSIAHGIASERDKQLLDFQRVAPLSTTSKIIGYLFGLPVREYYIFFLSMPVVIFGVFQGGMNILMVLHIYLIFGSTVLMYHLIGMAVGMVAPRPRMVATGLQMSIGVIYLAVFIQEVAGFEIFRYLTMSPAVFHILYYNGILPVEPFDTQTSFFNMTDLHPSVYTLIIQALISVTCILVVYRKWWDPFMHAVGKLYSLIFLLLTLILMIGSIWPQLFEHLVDVDNFFLTPEQRMQEDTLVTLIRIVIFLLIALPLTATLIFLTTPNKHGYLHGLRRARKFNRKRLAFHRDGADSWITSLILAGMTLGTYFLFIALINMVPTDRLVLPAADYSMAFISAAILLFALISIYACSSLLGSTGVVVYIFTSWMLPLMVSGIMSLWNDEGVFHAGMYIGSISPLLSMVVAAFGIFQSDAFEVLPRVNPEQILPISLSGLFCQILFATICLSMKFKLYRKSIKRVFHADAM